jgi:hypothetical protein
MSKSRGGAGAGAVLAAADDDDDDDDDLRLEGEVIIVGIEFALVLVRKVCNSASSSAILFED